MVSAVTRRHQELKRLYEAAKRDRKVNRFYEDFNEGLQKKHIQPKDFSIRQLFEQLVEDGRELAESFNPRQEGGVSLLEASGSVDTSAFSNISGQIFYNEMMNAYQQEDFIFSRMVRTIPTNLNGERMAGMGDLGDVGEIVGEGKAYPTAGVNEDWIDTPTTDKRGIIVPVTKEAIFFDKTGMVLDKCSKTGEALGVNKETRIIDAIIDENTTKHRYKWRNTSYATFQTASPWINKTASGNGLTDWTSIDAVEKLNDRIVDPNTGLPVMVNLKHLIVTRDNLNIAKKIVTATSVRTATPGYATTSNPSETEWANPISGYQILTSKLLRTRLASSTRWILADLDKLVVYMENWPITFTQAPSNSEAEFTQDIVFRFKASERGATFVKEPRAAQSSDA
jgi:hypothetical protein